MTESSDHSDGVIPLPLVLGTVAKVLCSAVFVSGRDVDEAYRTSAYHALFFHHLHEVLHERLRVEVDTDAHELTVTVRLDPASVEAIVTGYRDVFPDLTADWATERARLRALGSVARTARFVGDQGSLILPRDGGPVRFTPVPVRTSLPEPTLQDWPMGDRTPAHGPRSPVDRAQVEQAVDAAFADPAAHTAAVVVVHQGEIVGERYRPGVGVDTQLEGWSMGKSVTATLVGILVRQGLLTLDQPAPVPGWRRPGDPRAAITIRDLLQMSSGLRFSGQDDPRPAWRWGVPDHVRIYSDAFDVFEFAVDQPAEHPPGTVGRYRNCDPLTLGFVIRQVVTETLGQPYLSWPQAALFDRIGIRRQVLETDLYGNFLLTGFDFGTARNWARLGLLYLRDGEWCGQRILPDGWSTFVSTPAPGWAEPEYGGSFWLNRTGQYAVPEDAYYMAGFGEQRVFVVPSADLVVVRLGHRADTDAAKDSVDAMLGRLMAAVADVSEGSGRA